MSERSRLQVTFGIDLDDYAPAIPASACGRVIIGPLGLLGLLETRLGLGGLHEGRPLRVMQYLHGLKSADDGMRFYSRSLARDELVTARTLLAWRDQWVEAGWDGCADPTDGQRLRDLAAVESLARGQLSAGLADRLRAVRAGLAAGLAVDLEVESVDPLEELSWAWQNILRLLAARERPGLFLPEPQADQDTDLGRLQRALRDNRPVRLSGDHTVLLLTAHSRTVLADGLVRLLAGEVSGGRADVFKVGLATTLVASQDLDGLERALQDLDIPGTGASAASRWRPPLQVLPLALSLFWEPLDPHRLLEFLTLPISPLPAFVRYRLAKVVAEYPGMGGPAWTEECAALACKAVAEAGGDPQAAAALRDQFAQWLPGTRFKPDDGVPLRLVAEQAQRVSRWAASRAENATLDPAQRSLLLAATAQAAQAQRLLDEHADAGATAITRLQLERLLDQVTAEGTPLDGLTAELGHPPVCGDPGAVIDLRQRVVWWDFAEPALPEQPPWSRVEVAQLERHGVRLARLDRRLSSAARRWQRPLLAASRQVIFAAPRTSANEPVRHHPLWSTLTALSEETLPVLTVEQLLDEAAPPRPALQVTPLPWQPLPGPRRWWSLPRPELLGPRPAESFSSLDAFLKSPYQWVLRHKARLAPGSLARIDTGNRQRGNLLHRLGELLFTTGDVDWRSAPDSELQRWLRGSFEILLRQEGANYFLPGQSAAREELSETAARTMVRLVRHLRSAAVTGVQVEAKVSTDFQAGELTGSIDLLLTNAHGAEAVLDLKWGGGKYRRDELVKNTALQLAVYAYLRRSAGHWPATGYYILEESRLLAQDARFFPDAEICDPALAVDPAASLWQDFMTTWLWRRAQLDRGLIELTVTGTEPDADSVPPPGALPIEAVNDSFNDFAVLTGWGEGA